MANNEFTTMINEVVEIMRESYEDNKVEVTFSDSTAHIEVYNNLDEVCDQVYVKDVGKFKDQDMVEITMPNRDDDNEEETYYVNADIWLVSTTIMSCFEY